MSKYYVTTGNFENVLFAKSPREAAIKVLQSLSDGSSYGTIIQVGEKGLGAVANKSMEI